MNLRDPGGPLHGKLGDGADRPEMADTDSLSTSEAVIRVLEGLQRTGGSWWQAYLIDYRFSRNRKHKGRRLSGTVTARGRRAATARQRTNTPR